MSRIFKILGYLLLVIALVLVADMNYEQRVDLTWFPGRVVEDLPVFLVILGSIFIGVALAGALGTLEHFRHQARERELAREIEELEAELRELRNLPISEGLRPGGDVGDVPGPGGAGEGLRRAGAGEGIERGGDREGIGRGGDRERPRPGADEDPSPRDEPE